MPVGCVGIDLIDDNLQAKRMGTCNQCIEIGKCSENRIDIAIICNIIAEVLHG